MHHRLKLLIVTLITLTSFCHANELTLTTKQGFELKTTYNQPQTPTNRAVVLLHQCNSTRIMYKDIGKQLSQRGIHTLSLDFRWYGESISGATDIKELAKLPPAERKNPWPMIMEHWPAAVQLAYDFLREKIGEDGAIGVIGASCGGRQAQILAKNNSVAAMSFFSSAVVQNNDESVEDYQTTLAKIATLFVAAEQDGTFEGTKRGFTLNENIHSQFISYKGEEHGHPLLAQDKNLVNTIARWFDANLVN